MDILSMTSKYREDLLKFCKPILDDRSYIWVRGLMSDINHKIVVCDWNITPQALIMYKFIVPFFKKQAKNVTASTILYSLYTCAIELNLRELGDEVETFEQFQDGIDMDDWKKVSSEDIKSVDALMASRLFRNVKFKDKYDVTTCGIYTLEIYDNLLSE